MRKELWVVRPESDGLPEASGRGAERNQAGTGGIGSASGALGLIRIDKSHSITRAYEALMRADPVAHVMDAVVSLA